MKKKQQKKQTDMTETDTNFYFLDTKTVCVSRIFFTARLLVIKQRSHSFPSLSHFFFFMKSHCQQSPSLLTREKTNEGSGSERTGRSHIPPGIHEYTLAH